MENDQEISSSTLSFGSMPAGVSNEPEASPDHLSLTNLSLSLERLLLYPGLGYTDADIIVDDVPVGIHRCLLAARSDFFHSLFSKQPGNDSQEGGNPKYYMSELVASTQGYVGLEAFDVVLKYVYTGKMVQSPPGVSTCVDDQCIHEACRPAIDYAIELFHAFSNFNIKEPLSLVQRHLRDFVNKACIDDVIPILVASFHCNSQQLLSACIHRVSLSDLDNMVIEKEVPTAVWLEVKRLRDETGQGSDIALLPQDPSDHEKRIKRIHKALDSDDVELMSLLLRESSITLDDAFALHYAVAYSDSKVVKKVLELKQADLNLKNSRGFTALHVAARRKVPSILGALIENGACAFETTPDGQRALGITRRLTRPKDYNQNLQKGKESNKDKVCIDLLERAMKNASAFGGRPVVLSEVTADDLHELEYFEGRVKIATMLFPTEAMTAMEMAEAEWTTIYKSLSLKDSWKTGKGVGQKETTPMSAAELRLKLQALRKTVEIGERYFPNCSEKIITFSDIDLPDALYLEKGTEEEKEYKKRRYNEFQEVFMAAFNKDMAVNNMPSSSFPIRSSSPTTSSTSSSAPRNRSRNKTRAKV